MKTYQGKIKKKYIDKLKNVELKITRYKPSRNKKTPVYSITFVFVFKFMQWVLSKNCCNSLDTFCFGLSQSIEMRA